MAAIPLTSVGPFPSLFKPTPSFPISFHSSYSYCFSYNGLKLKSKTPTMVFAVVEDTIPIVPPPPPPSSSSSSSNNNNNNNNNGEEEEEEEASRRVYIGNIPRNLTTDDLLRLLQHHAAVDKAQVMYDKYSGRSRRFGFATMKTVEDANAVIDKLNGTEIGGRQIKVNITEKPLEPLDLSLLQADESQFVDTGYKVYVGNLAKTVTTDTLKSFFSGKGKVIGAKVQRAPGTSKSSGFGFVSFSSAEEVDAAIIAFNNAELEGQKIRVNKA